VTKPFCERREAILKQIEQRMPQLNKGAIMLQTIINGIYREFLRSTFSALATQESRR
jgi:hypothetical protein